MKQPIKVSLQTYLENLCENFAWKCFQLNLTLSFYRFVHFNCFSRLKKLATKPCNLSYFINFWTSLRAIPNK